MTRTGSTLTLSALLTLAAAVAPAAAAPPANDARVSAAPLTVPDRVSGTLVEATAEPAEPRPGCGPRLGPSVWYRLEPAGGPVALELKAAEGAGNVVAVYRREGGDLTPEICDASDRRGEAAVVFTADRGERYLVQVATGVRADPGTFTLGVFRPEAPPSLPGPRLPAAGAHGTVDVIRDTQDAFSMVMRSGVTYRVNLDQGADPGCRVGFRILGAGSRDLDATAVAGRPCGGYLTYTPGPDDGGVHAIVVEARSGSGVRNPRYRLTAGTLGADDQAPGLELPLGSPVRGVVSGKGLDRLDLYRFDVTNRSRVRLRLATPGASNLRLMRAEGGTIQCVCGQEGNLELERALAPGSYLALVQAQDGRGGRYRLLRTSRTITSAAISVNGSSDATAPLGASVTVRLRVTPTVDGGRVRIDAEQYDPLGGWRFRRRLEGTVSGGVASIAFRPTGAGPWRFRGDYLGSPSASPATASQARLTVR
ncbi:MAG: hypothetical protein U0237_00365 [Thermoleophilia bacterium]